MPIFIIEHACAYDFGSHVLVGGRVKHLHNSDHLSVTVELSTHKAVWFVVQ